MRIIDADKLLEDIANSGLVWETYELLDVIEILAVKKIIDDEPTVEERPKGKWIIKHANGCNYYICSECSVLSNDWDNFCPNCGADMRGEDA